MTIHALAAVILLAVTGAAAIVIAALGTASVIRSGRGN